MRLRIKSKMGSDFGGPLAWVAVFAGVFFGVAGIQATNTVPAWVPLVGMDSGVAVCKAIAETPKGQKVPLAVGEEQAIRELRARFADSRYDDIRINGVAMMDLSAQYVAMRNGSTDPDLGTAFALVSPMMTANAGLAGGCREHGYEIPAMGAKQ